MEGDTNVYSDKSRRPTETSNLPLNEKARRGGPSGRGARGGKRGGGEGRSRGGRGRRGGGKPVESTRDNLVNVTVQNPSISKPIIKPNSETREPPLLEVGHKVVVRRLPPTLPKDILLETVNSLAFVKDKYEWSSFFPGKVSDNPSKSRVFSRAYFRFTDSTFAVKFMDAFNGHVFIDSKGVQDQALVEYAPYRKTPKQARIDPKQGTIEEDPEYQDFLVSLIQQANEPPTPTLQSAPLPSEKVKITPLIEFLRAKKAAQAESRSSFRASKSSVTLLSRNDKGKNSEASASQNSSNSRESGSKNKEDKKSKKSKSSKAQIKESKPFSEFKPNNEEGDSRRSRRRSRKKGPFKEEPSVPFAPTQILKAPPKTSDNDWPQPGSSSKSSQPAKETVAKVETSASESKPAPVRHVFTLTNGCLTQSTKASDSLDNATPKASRNNRRRRAPPSKPQTAS